MTRVVIVVEVLLQWRHARDRELFLGSPYTGE